VIKKIPISPSPVVLVSAAAMRNDAMYFQDDSFFIIFYLEKKLMLLEWRFIYDHHFSMQSEDCLLSKRPTENEDTEK
jgi:hypothetical protein